MLCVVGAGLFLGVSALLLGVAGSSRVAPITILAWIGVPLGLLVGWGWLPLRPLVDRCKISLVSVPVAITLPHRCILEGSRVRSIRRPIVDLAVGAVVRIAI